MPDANMRETNGPTPGPWRVDGVVSTIVWTAGEPYGHGRMRIADVRGWGHLTGQGACRFSEDKAVEIQDANGHLIAAAPEMKQALESAPILSQYHGAEGFEVDRFISDYNDWRARCAQALAKAAGRSQEKA